MNKRKMKVLVLIVMFAVLLTGCGARQKNVEKENRKTTVNKENVLEADTTENDESSEKEKVTTDEATILTENETTTVMETQEVTTTVPQPTVPATTEPITQPVTQPTEPAIQPTTATPPQNTGTKYDVVYYSRRKFNDAVYAEAKRVVNSIITSGMSEVQKVRAIHDYIVLNTSYAHDVANNMGGYTGAEPEFSAYGALINKSAVCEGYAEAFLLLCWSSGIEARLVVGAAYDDYGNGGGHEWNVVKVNGKWYQVDCTWDDPVIYSGGVPIEDNSNLNYNYFLITDEDMKNDHDIEEYYNTTGIVCDSKDYYEYATECSLQQIIGSTPYKKVTNYDEAKQAMNGFFVQGYTTFAMVYVENTLDANTLMDNALRDYMAYNNKLANYSVQCSIMSSRGLTITTITLAVN